MRPWISVRGYLVVDLHCLCPNSRDSGIKARLQGPSITMFHRFFWGSLWLDILVGTFERERPNYRGVEQSRGIMAKMVRKGKNFVGLDIPRSAVYYDIEELGCLVTSICFCRNSHNFCLILYGPVIDPKCDWGVHVHIQGSQQRRIILVRFPCSYVHNAHRLDPNLDIVNDCCIVCRL